MESQIPNQATTPRKFLSQSTRTMRAYALMQRSEDLEAAYIRSPVYVRAAAEVEVIRAVLPGVVPLQYRGIGRYPFTEYPEKGPGWQGDGEVPVDPEPHARALLLRFL